MDVKGDAVAGLGTGETDLLEPMTLALFTASVLSVPAVVALRYLDTRSSAVLVFLAVIFVFGIAVVATMPGGVALVLPLMKGVTVVFFRIPLHEGVVFVLPVSMPRGVVFV